MSFIISGSKIKVLLLNFYQIKYFFTFPMRTNLLLSKVFLVIRIHEIFPVHFATHSYAESPVCKES